MTMKNRVAFTARLFLLRLAVASAIVLCAVQTARAGGPKYVAGRSFFDVTKTGQPVVWPGGIITYYTDQGDLSAILPNASANSFVAGAFGVWTSVPTAALVATNSGQLGEDVSGANVTVNADGTIAMPLDIQATASGSPIGIVYDADGSVTDALLGAGAGGADQCFFNAVFGGDDSFGSFGTVEHALIVMDGQCAQQASQLTDVEYRLVRVIGGVLGLGWSQLNLNVETGSPVATAEDYAGFPVMHYFDPFGCVPITLCYANPFQLSADDVAAVSRLYPVTPQNVAGFPGKQVLSSTTARIHGSVWFTDAHANRTQPMQGVNVVARWIDPHTGRPSRRYAASSVSGFLFTGNTGNPITGFADALGNSWFEWGSVDPTVEGFFDLGGLVLPEGGSTQYQVSVEGLDLQFSGGVGPYAPGPVTPSGTAAPITVTVSAGVDVAQDILMNGAAQPQTKSSSWNSPAGLPTGGDWVASLSGYGDVDYFLLPAQANRTLSVSVTALDESGRATQLKAQPVIGMWAASDPEGTAPPAFTSSPFNQLIVGTTRLDTQVLATKNFLIGIADVRGDGRPDYRYHARALYADTVSPARVGVNGGAVTVHGTGFANGLTASIGGVAAAQLAMSASDIALQVPARADGVQSITINDPVSGASTAMTGVLTYGAAASDAIVLVSGSNPPTPVGTQAARPVTVRVLAADGVTRVSGATVTWSANNSLQLSACGGASSCSVMSNQSGEASTWGTPGAVGVATIVATLAPGSYSSAKSVSTMLSATQSSSDIGAVMPSLFVSEGATVALPLTVRLLSNGVARSNAQVNFTIPVGVGSLSAATANTNANGYASVTLTATQIASLVQVAACAAPSNAPCTTFYANPTALAQQHLLQVSGSGQVTTGTLQPVTVQVVDSAVPANPVIAAPVVFQTTVLRPGGTSAGVDESNPGNPAMPVILAVSQSTVLSDVNGLAGIVPSGGGYSPPVEVDVMVTAGTGAFLDNPLQLLPAVAGGSGRVAPFRRGPVGWVRGE